MKKILLLIGSLTTVLGGFFVWTMLSLTNLLEKEDKDLFNDEDQDLL